MGEKIPVIPQSERCALFGNTRQGKSQLSKALLRAKRHVIVVDTKQREDWSDVATDGKPTVGGVDAIKKAVGAHPGNRHWWKPSFTDLPYDEQKEIWDEFFTWCLALGNMVIFCDEIIDIAESATKYPPRFRRAVKKGGASGLGIWGTTQEPVGIPKWSVGQADFLFTFHVGLPEYRQRINEIFEERIPWDELTAYSYRFVWKDRHGFHGPTKLDLKAPGAPTPTKVLAPG